MDPVRALINRTLDREAWARERLQAHAGTSFRVIVGLASVTHAIDASGRLGEATGEPDVTLTISPLRLPALLAQPARWPNIVHAQGDAALASTLAELASTAPLFAEQALAKVVGPVVASQVAIAGASAMQMPEYAAQRVADSVAVYVAEQSDAAVNKAEAQAFASDVAALSADIDTLAARVDAAVARLARQR
jgi:ubiquinone biosynthesis protein UbiJ